MSADHIHFFLQLRTTIKLYHWQTKVYARHIATDTILEKIDENIDAFVELYIGKYGRPKMSKKTILLQNITDAAASRLLKNAIHYLQTFTKSLHPSDYDLLTIRDEMMQNISQLQYLFTLH